MTALHTPEARDEDGRAAAWRARSVTRPYFARTGLILAVSLLTFFAVAVSAQHIGSYAVSQGFHVLWATLPGAALVLAAVYVLVMAAQAFAKSVAAKRSADVYAARALGAQASVGSWKALSWSAALLIFVGFCWFMVVNDAAVSRTFFDLELIKNSSYKVLKAFGTNITIFVISAVLILVWSLIVVLARTLPGEVGRPLRFLAIVYGDLFRGLPAIITIYLIGFGLPLTNLPIISELSTTSYAIIALVLTYGAYVSEVYRSGIDSVHHSQVAAARSLGLSYGKTMRYVTIPLAVRNIVPSLMNNCIALQKDTALVAIIGTIDSFNQSKIIAANNFNLSAVTTVAILFIAVTIPQTRALDRMTERDRRRMRAGG